MKFGYRHFFFFFLKRPGLSGYPIQYLHTYNTVECTVECYCIRYRYRITYIGYPDIKISDIGYPDIGYRPISDIPSGYRISDIRISDIRYPISDIRIFFFFKCLIYLDPRTREKYKRNKMGNRPIPDIRYPIRISDIGYRISDIRYLDIRISISRDIHRISGYPISGYPDIRYPISDIRYSYRISDIRISDIRYRISGYRISGLSAGRKRVISGSPGLSGGTFLSFFVMATSR